MAEKFDLESFESLSNQDKYLKILGVESDKLPSIGEFPEQVVLDENLLGGFNEAIAATNSDGLERRNKTNDPDNIQVAGKDRTVALPNFFGEKALLEWHTHPNPENELDALAPIMSFDDIRHTSFNQNMAFMRGVGSEYGGMFVMQSDEAAKTPVSSTAKMINTTKSMRQRLEDKNRDRAAEWQERMTSGRELSQIDASHSRLKIAELRALGYECYVWTAVDFQDGNLILHRYDTVASDHEKYLERLSSRNS